jgi:hypothetical protein
MMLKAKELMHDWPSYSEDEVKNVGFKAEEVVVVENLR